MDLLAVAEILEAAASKAREIHAARRDDARSWTDQSSSPLGSRRHIAAVRRRLAEGRDGAGQSGRRYLLSADALAEELGRPLPSRPENDDGDYAAKVRAELRLVGARH